MSSALPLSRLIIYALPAIPLAALTLPLYSFIPTFYAETIGLPLAGIGLALFLVRAFDAVNDPLVGILADRFRPAFGRRRLWFACAIPIVMLGVWQLFWPPADASIWYLGLWSLVLSVGYTLAILPFTAWGAELETSYEGRSRVTGMREGLTLIGTLLAIIIPFSLGWEDASAFHGFALLAVCLILALPLTGVLTVWRVPEPREHSTTRVGIIAGLSHVKSNRAFIRLACAFFLNGCGNSIAATLFLLYCSARLGLEDLRGPFLFTYFLCGVVSVPFWTFVARKTSKHRAWCCAMIFAAIVFSPAPFLSEGAAFAFGAICVLSGLALGADIALPPSMQADVIDVDTAKSGEQRSGVYFSLWSLATKMSLALAVAGAFSLLGWFGFDAQQPQQSTQMGLTALGFLYGWGPIALKLPSLALMWNFPLGREQVEHLRAQIDSAQRA
ncbi:MAG: MFS transporter [Ahrensia sp.]|nr:MFS transporter [Ahrensia sp.]